jgi:ABC-type transport system substrate-binding protein
MNAPNYRMVLKRNPNYHDEFYPSEGDPEDAAAGLLTDAGKKLPFIDEAVFVLEKEAVPKWNKLLQGYYDSSGIGSDTFDQAVKVSNVGEIGLTPEMEEKHIRLSTAVELSTYYYSFNMNDEVFGGIDSEKKQKLRQAVSIALNIEEEIQIFQNGRGIPAQNPIPPGIFGYQDGKAGINPYVYDWDEKNAKPRRKSIEDARKLMAEAGYPGGRDAEGKPLIINYDYSSGGVADKSLIDWMRKQFKAIGMDLHDRVTDYNRFQEKALKGDFQLLSWGWNADYPDPENFLFLLYGPNGKVKSQGENVSNYDNAEFNTAFKKMEVMNDSPARMDIIRGMLNTARKDAPWIWGYHPVAFGLRQEWMINSKPMLLGGNSLKYKRINVELREQRRAEWNRPVRYPIWIALGLLAMTAIPAAVMVYRRERTAPQS